MDGASVARHPGTGIDLRKHTGEEPRDIGRSWAQEFLGTTWSSWEFLGAAIIDMTITSIFIIFSHWDQQPCSSPASTRTMKFTMCFHHVFHHMFSVLNPGILPWNSLLGITWQPILNIATRGPTTARPRALGSGTRNTRRASSRCRSQGIDARRRSLGGALPDPMDLTF